LKLGVAHRCHPSHFVYDRVRGRSSMPEDKRKP
jgi:hypothetical protein